MNILCKIFGHKLNGIDPLGSEGRCQRAFCESVSEKVEWPLPTIDNYKTDMDICHMQLTESEILEAGGSDNQLGDMFKDLQRENEQLKKDKEELINCYNCKFNSYHFNIENDLRCDALNQYVTCCNVCDE